MKVTNTLMAMAVVALLPLAASAGDEDKTPAPMGTVTSAQFDMLDANRDGRISVVEANMDSKIVFSSADKNGDGYLDAVEFQHRDKLDTGKGEPASPDREAPKPRQ